MKRLLKVSFLFFFLVPICFADAPPPKRPRHTARLFYEKQFEDVPVGRSLGARTDVTVFSNENWEVRNNLEYVGYRSNVGSILPQDVYETGIRFTARRQPFLVLAGVSSNSDSPFHSVDEMDLLFTGSVDVYATENSRLFLSLQYNSKRTFLKDIPLPFIGYEYREGGFFLLAGVPFILRNNFDEHWVLRLTYFPVMNTDLELAYRESWYFESALVFRWLNTKFLLAGRSNKNEFSFYEYQQVGLRVRWTLPYFFVGYRFSPLAYQGESYGDSQNLTRYDPSFVIQTGLELALF